MVFWESAIRYSKRFTSKEHFRAAVVTALFPAAIAILLLWVFPKGCDLRGDPAAYRWTCLLPGLLLIVPFATAIGLLIGTKVNYRLGWRLPDGWLTTILITGIFAQILWAATYLLALDPAYWRLFLAEIFLIPQPFFAGALAGAIYQATLYWQFGKPNLGHSPQGS